MNAQSRFRKIWMQLEGQRGQSMVEYLAILAFGLAFMVFAIGHAGDEGALYELLEGLRTAYQRMVHALSLPI